MESNATENTSFNFNKPSLQNPYNLTIGCKVQYGMPVKYGVIKWIGQFSDDYKTVIAGLVMV